MANFELKIDVSQVARALGKTREVIETILIPEARNLAISTHGFILKFAKEKMADSYKLPIFLGKKDKNVRWIEVTPGLWVVEIDDSVAWIETGRPPTSMATEQWL